MSAMLLLFDDGGFNPRSLFAAGAQGAWYDPSDFSTLFQDSAGTTPVTAFGQPVGLMLDKRLGLALGAELVTNGDFSNGATGWTISQTGASVVAVAGGIASISSPAGDTASIATTPAGTTNGNKYVVQFDATITSGAGYVYFGDTSGAASRYSFATSGRKTAILTKGSVTALLGFSREAAGANFSVDNISVREIAGNHADQTTAASRPTAQSNYLSLDKADDHLLVAAGGAGTTGFLLVAGIMVPAAGTARTLWSDRGTNAGYKVGIDASNQIVFSAGNGAGFVSATGPALVAGTKYVITAWHDGANLNVSVNNGAPTQAAFVTATAGAATFTIGKSNGAATEYWGDRIYGMIYRKNDASNTSQRNQAYSYMVGKMGGL
jgi:hypothetical protein